MSLLACASPEEKAASYIENADELVAEGKLDKAEIEYKNALQINQNLPDAWFGIAKINERKQEWRKAFVVLNKIREMAPKHVDGRIMLAQILLASNQIDQALTDASEILELAPEKASAHSLMAAVQFRLENHKGALLEVDKALEIEPGNNEALLVRARILIAEKKFDQALQVLDKSIESSPGNVSLYLMKIQAFNEKKDKQAIEGVYLSLIKRFPDNPAFKTALLQQYLSDNKIDSAEQLLEQLVESDPSNVDEKLRLVSFKNRHRSKDVAIALAKSYINDNKSEYRYRFLLGGLYEANEQSDEAKAVYQEVVSHDELKANGLRARNKIALLEIRAGNHDKAFALVNEVLTQDKANEEALLIQTGFLIADKKYDDALVSARTVLRDNPDSIKALGLLGQAYSLMGSTELALESYTKAFQLNPGASLIANRLAQYLVRQRKFQQADEVLLKSISSGNMSLEAIKILTQVKLSLGQWDKAEQLANQLQSVEGQEALSQQMLGIVYQGREDQDASIDAFQRAHELAPESAQPISALVQTYVRNGKVKEARRFLQSVLSSNSENVTAYILLGQLSLYEKDTGTAIELFNKAIEINPKTPAPYKNLAAIHVRANDFDKAEKVTKQGLEAMPDLPLLALNLASIYERQGEFDKAMGIYETMLEKNPNLIVARNNLASLLTDYSDDPNARERARSIAADLKTSKVPQFRDTYAWASVKAGTNLEEAVVLLEGIVKENEQVDVYHYHLGEAYRKKGDLESARTSMKKAVDLARPGSSIAKQATESLNQLK
ncbi:MAG: tetratricopeptide repeat protein [Gammaproteobacteria bacterium]|nr:tetratricopeptide repeat protein [Gammaproteobacteria bacterium]